MLKVLLLFVLACGFVACDENDLVDLVRGDAIALPVGDYFTECVVDGTESHRTDVAIVSQTEIQTQLQTHTSSTDCTGPKTDDPIVTLTGEASDFSVANVAFFGYTDSEDMVARSFAYSVQDGLVYVSEAQTEVDEENATSKFSDFVSDPKGKAFDVFTPVP